MVFGLLFSSQIKRMSIDKTQREWLELQTKKAHLRSQLYNSESGWTFYNLILLGISDGRYFDF